MAERAEELPPRHEDTKVHKVFFVEGMCIITLRYFRIIGPWGVGKDIYVTVFHCKYFRVMEFKSTILLLPGLGNSGEGHWQTLWEKEYPGFIRVHQSEWITPDCGDWMRELNKKIIELNSPDVILVAHSAACALVAHWTVEFRPAIKAALLVAPADTEANSFPRGTSGFSPMPLHLLPFPSIVVGSENDFYVTAERARLFANAWGSEFVSAGNAGHVNPASGFGRWDMGLTLLKKLDNL